MANVRSAVAIPLTLVIALGLASGALAEDIRVAVAANFLAPCRVLAADFARAAGVEVVVSSGSSGGFFAQIRNGAPFDVFLSADQDRPRLLEEQGYAAKGSRFTYATGVLVVWSADPGRIGNSASQTDLRALLTDPAIAHIAIANPRIAPYGVAAQQTLEAIGAWERVQPKLLLGEDVSQTYQFAAAGGAELAFVPLSTIDVPGHPSKGSSWRVPESLHAPIRQDAVLLVPGAKKPGAAAFLAYLKAPAGLNVIRGYGYSVEPTKESR